MGELVIRLVFSLAVVVGLLILLSRLVGRRFAGTSRSVVKVLHRQPLSRSTAVAVVSVGARVLVLGTTEHQVSLLAELSPEEGAAAQELTRAAGSHRAPGRSVKGPAPDHAPDALATTDPHRSDPDFGRDLQDALTADVEWESIPAVTSSRLTGSLLAPQTWRDAVTAAKGRVR